MPTPRQPKHIPVCRHHHSAAGCALGALCPNSHVGTQLSGLAEMEKLRAVDESHGGRPVWVYRENPCPQQSAARLRWKVLHDHHVGSLEKALVDGETIVPISGSVAADLERMMLFDRFDGGSRRPLQRVMCSNKPQWFAFPIRHDDAFTPCEQDDEGTSPATSGAATEEQELDDPFDLERRRHIAIHFSPMIANVLEFAYASGCTSYFGLRAAERPAWVNLCTMQMIELDSGLRFHLRRQPFTVQAGSRPSDMYRHVLLQHSGSYCDRQSETMVPCATMASHVPVAAGATSDEVNIPAVLPDFSSPGPTTVCPGFRCVNRCDAAHMRTSLHPCPQGRRGDCFLCLCVPPIVDSSVTSPVHAAVAAVDRRRSMSPMALELTPPSTSLQRPTSAQRRSEALSTIKETRRLTARATVHVQLYRPATTDPSGASVSVAESSAREWRAAQRTQLPLMERAWRDHMPGSVAYTGSTNMGLLSVEGFLAGSSSVMGRSATNARRSSLGVGVDGLTFVDRDSSEYAAVVAALEKDQVPFTLPVAAHVQRVTAAHVLREFVRFRNEVQWLWLSASATEKELAMQCFCVTRYLPVPTAMLALRDSSDFVTPVTLYRSMDAALEFIESKRSPGDTDAACVVVVSMYPGPSVALTEADAVAPTLRRGDESDARRCLVNLSVLGTRHDVVHDGSQFCPFYVISIPHDANGGVQGTLPLM